MNQEKISVNIFHIANVSIALACAFWLILIRQCYINVTEGIGGGFYQVINCPSYLEYLAQNRYVDRIDFFFVAVFYLAFLFITIFFFLVVRDSWIERVKGWKYFFLTANVIFLGFLFFEI